MSLALHSTRRRRRAQVSATQWRQFAAYHRRQAERLRADAGAADERAAAALRQEAGRHARCADACDEKATALEVRR